MGYCPTPVCRNCSNRKPELLCINPWRVKSSCSEGSIFSTLSALLTASPLRRLAIRPAYMLPELDFVGSVVGTLTLPYNSERPMSGQDFPLSFQWMSFSIYVI